MPSPPVVGILVVFELSCTNARWIVSNVGAVFGKCIERMALAEKVPRTSSDKESGIVEQCSSWIGGKKVRLQVLEDLYKADSIT